MILFEFCIFDLENILDILSQFENLFAISFLSYVIVNFSI